MILKLENREKVNVHLIGNKVNEIIEYLNNLEIENVKKSEELKK